MSLVPLSSKYSLTILSDIPTERTTARHHSLSLSLKTATGKPGAGCLTAGRESLSVISVAICFKISAFSVRTHTKSSGVARCTNSTLCRLPGVRVGVEKMVAYSYSGCEKISSPSLAGNKL